MNRLLCAALGVLALLSSAATDTSQKPGGALPEKLERYLTDVVKLPSGQRRQLLQGAPVTRLLDADGSKEVAVLGAVWIDAPIRRYVEAVQDIEKLERGGGFKMTKRISTPPKQEDFARMRLPAEDVEDLQACRVGDCAVKLSERSLQRFHNEVDWSSPNVQAAADAVMQRLALEYVNGYLKGGNARLASYRDNSEPTIVAEEFRAMVDRMPELTTFMPSMRQYLLEFPEATLPDSTSFLYWQEVEFGLKPTIRISHLTIREGPDDTVVASRMLYASHYFWTGLELRALLPDPARGNGFWFVTVNRSRTDGLTGFTGLFVRRRVRSGVQAGALTALRATKAALEGSASTPSVAQTMFSTAW